MTTTTKTERPRPSATGGAGATTLRLYLVAFLAAAYVFAWWLFGARAPARAAAAVAVAPALETLREPRLATWFHDLAPTERPHVAVPAGWHIADTTAPASVTRRNTPVPVRVSPARPGRIRTRSS